MKESITSILKEGNNINCLQMWLSVKKKTPTRNSKWKRFNHISSVKQEQHCLHVEINRGKKTMTKKLKQKHLKDKTSTGKRSAQKGKCNIFTVLSHSLLLKLRKKYGIFENRW